MTVVSIPAWFLESSDGYELTVTATEKTFGYWFYLEPAPQVSAAGHWSTVGQPGLYVEDNNEDSPCSDYIHTRAVTGIMSISELATGQAVPRDYWEKQMAALRMQRGRP